MKTAVVCCPKCYGVGYFVRTRYFGTSAADVWECQSPNCTGFGLIWHTERPYNEDEKHAVRHRVLLAESAVMNARQAVIDAEVELAGSGDLFGLWVPTAERVPANPDGFPRNDHVPCLCVWRDPSGGGDMRILQWNAYYKVWDDADGDDFFCEVQEVTHWMPLPPWPNTKFRDAGGQSPHRGRTINRILCNALLAFSFMTTTPQTDAFVAHMADQFRYPSWIEFAQDMERENARLREALENLVSQCKSGDDITAWWKSAVERAESALANV